MDLKYFNLCSGALVPDVMHDVLEGALQREIKLVLQYCIVSKKYFRLSYLTQLMESFEFGYMEVQNRPTPIQRKTLSSKDYSLQQNGMYMYLPENKIVMHASTLFFTASQMWLLGRTLPAMIGHLVPEDDEHWQNLMLLLHIVGYLLAPRLVPDEADYLQMLIDDHHSAYKTLYPDETIPPKFHYMVHMPRLIKE